MEIGDTNESQMVKSKVTSDDIIEHVYRTGETPDRLIDDVVGPPHIRLAAERLMGLHDSGPDKQTMSAL